MFGFKANFKVGLIMIGVLLPSLTLALTVAPPIFDVAGNPNDVLLEKIKVYNESAKAITVTVTGTNFRPAKTGDSSPEFFNDNSSQSLASWISFSKKAFVIKAKSGGEIPFSVNIPSKATPGGHYGAVLLGINSEVPSSVSVSSQIATLILLRVNGLVKEAARVDQFVVKQSSVELIPESFLVRFENDGNTHLQPSGEIIIRNFFGLVSAKIPLNVSKNNILPQTIRQFSLSYARTKPTENSWLRELKDFGLGRYTAELKVAYGQKVQILTATKTFSVWPARLMILFGVLIVLVLAVGVLFYKKRHVFKK